MWNQNNPAVKVWSIIYPIALYYAVLVIAMFLFQGIFGTDEKQYMLCQILASLVTIPVVYHFYWQDKKLEQAAEMDSSSIRKLEMQKKTCYHAIWIVVISACIGISLNNLISMSPLVAISEGYAEANRNFYGSTLVLELIGSALITPFLEELLYRGVVYSRLRKMLGWIPAVLLSAFLFALIHFNIVQFIYAFLLGILLAFFVEREGNFYAAFLGHVTVNLIAVVRTETGMLAWTMDKTPVAWIMSAILGVLGLVFLYFYGKICKKIDENVMEDLQYGNDNK